MPFKSEAQHRKFRAMVADGNMEQSTLDKMMDETKAANPKSKHPIKALPEKVKLAFRQALNGGRADDKDLKDFDPVELKKGMQVEFEHTNSRDVAREIAMDHLTEHKDYYKGLKIMEDTLNEQKGAPKKDKYNYKTAHDANYFYKQAMMNEMVKEAGGPGSGVTGDNTAEIDFLETSPLVSIGKRKKFMEHKTPVVTEDISVDNIKYKGQEKCVPRKLQKFLDAIESGEKWPLEKPIDVIQDDNKDYHLMDGHHRGIAAMLTDRDKIKANVYTANNSEKVKK